MGMVRVPPCTRPLMSESARTSAKGRVAQHARTNLYGLGDHELATLLKEWGQPKFRAKQIKGWLYGTKAVSAIDDMFNLPKDLRARLSESTTLGSMQVAHEQVVFALPRAFRGGVEPRDARAGAAADALRVEQTCEPRADPGGRDASADSDDRVH